MKIIESLQNRRSYYNIEKRIPVEEKEIFSLLEQATELVPDAFNMKSSRVVTVTGNMQDILWDSIYDLFGGNVSREKIDSFKKGYGTVLYFYENEVVKGLQEKFPLYADNFPLWASQSSAMLQLTIWSGLRELGIGASLQHYNPIIDETVKKLLNLPASYILVAQMPFGGIVEEASPKEKENIQTRVQFIK